MRSNRQPPTRAACLICREAKIRCDGRQPCSRCSARGFTCAYRPSQRGGVRRRPVNTSRHSAIPHLPAQSQSLFPAGIYASRQRPLAFMQSSSLADHAISTNSLESVINPPAHLRPNVRSSGAEKDSLIPVPDNEDNRRGETQTIRTYVSEEDILNAYYIHIHTFLPILPPPMSMTYRDIPIWISPESVTNGLDKDTLPHWPMCSLTLAMSAILALIPPSRHSFDDPEKPLRRLQAHIFAQAAYDEVHNEIDRVIRTPTRNVPSREQANPSSNRLYPILALCLLSVYEYCQRGSISRMRSHANQALTAALDLSLHNLDETSTEAERRTWWIAMLVSYLSSIDHQAPPIITVSDPRITTPLPSFEGSSEPLSLFLEAEQALMSVPELLNNISGNSSTSDLPSDLSDKIMQIHSHLSTLIKKSNRLSNLSCKQGPDAFALKNMLAISTLFIHCARIRLHRARAFMDIPMFLRKYCDLSGIEDQGENTVTSMYSDDHDSNFPFTKEESSLACLKSALAISRGIESLMQVTSSPDLSLCSIDYTPISDGQVDCLLPIFACSAIQSSYVLLMCHYRLQAALVSGNLAPCHYLLNNPEEDSEIQDAQRLMREIRHGLESILGAMKAAHTFEGVDSMMKEVDIACKLAFGAFSSDSQE